MEFRDLRQWIEAVRGLGELRDVRGAHWDLEMGTIVDLYQRRMGLPALLFDEIGDYPAGWRVLANTLTSRSRIALTLGLPATTDARGIVLAWREHARRYPTVPCRVLDTRLGHGPFNGTLNPPVDVLGSPCGVPSQSQAYVFNTTLVPQGPIGYLTLWPDGIPQPTISTLNAYDGALTSNMAIVPAGMTNGKVDAYAFPVNQNDPTDVTDLILDISSFFAP